MKINMQIAMTHDDIANAIRSYLRSEIPLRDDQDIVVVLTTASDGTIYATAITDKGEDTPVTENKPARTRRTKAQIQAEEEAEAAAKTEPSSQEADTPPFEINREVATPTISTFPEVDDSKTIEADTVSIPAPASSLSIFPNVGSSAPAIVQPTPAPAPVVIGAKSLFANLGNPSAAAH